jgi:hypothetical protein
MFRFLATAVLVLVLGVTWPVIGEGQSRPAADSSGESRRDTTSLTDPTDTRWEVSLYSRLGVPSGYLRVGENQLRGTRLRLHEDLGIDVSEALEASVAFHVTPRDALRATYLYYFLEGGARFDQTISYNGDSLGPGHLHTNADFYRVSLDYERLLSSGYGAFLTGSVGLTYVQFNPTLSGKGHSNSEDFYRQELPVPIVGFRVDIPMGPRFAARASVGGGGLPRVDSGRKEGGTVYLQQIHADAGLSVVYAITRALLVDVGYHFTYFFQHEKSHEDDNAFELIDSGARAGLTLRF